MKKQHVTLFIVGLLSMLAVAGFSQSVSFTYDAAGNRVTRALTLQKINSNAGSLNDSTEKHTALIEAITIDDVEVTISPNPNGGKFKVSISNLNDQSNVKIFLHTMTGKLVFETIKPKPITTVNISNRENGTYILTVIVNGTSEAWKVIKQ